jgi:hypothetical protein
MNKAKIEAIIRGLEKVYNINELEKLARKYQFIKRRGKVSAKCFLNLCTFAPVLR